MSQVEKIRSAFEDFYQGEVNSYFPDGSVHFEAIKYSLLSKGKRLRPLLCLSAAELVKGNTEWAKICSASIEMLHTYSLVHDDLPAMDDDDFRRGVATCHKVFGEDIAILAGDGLLNESISFMANKLQEAKCPDHLILKLVQIMTAKSGVFGMIWGQAVDLHPGEITLEKILWIHELKTAKLFQASLHMGSFCQGSIFPDMAFQKAIENVGKELGIIFQLLDDLDDWNQHKKEPLNILNVVDVPTFWKMLEDRFEGLWLGLHALTELPVKETLLGEIVMTLEEKFRSYSKRELLATARKM